MLYWWFALLAFFVMFAGSMWSMLCHYEYDNVLRGTGERAALCFLFACVWPIPVIAVIAIACGCVVNEWRRK